jgi:hypothetical protein
MTKRISLLLLLSGALALVVAGCGSDGSTALPDGGDAAASAVYPRYVDTDENGVNDYVEAPWHEPHPYNDFIDLNGDGICDFAQDGGNAWFGPGYVDTNGNSIADYWDEMSPMHNQHLGLHYVDGDGNGVNDYVEAPWHDPHPYHDFVDLNADGICDFAQDGSTTWHGPGYVDQDTDGVCDYWQPGGTGYGMPGGGGMGGGMPMGGQM